MANDERQVARQLVQWLVKAWLEWSGQLRDQEQLLSSGGQMTLSIAVPNYPGHALRFAVRGPGEIEIHYDDGQPPGPAEACFGRDNAPAVEVIEDVLGYLGHLMSGEIVVVRERLPWWARLLRGDGADSLSRFVEKNAAARRSHRLCVYSLKKDVERLIDEGHRRVT